IEVLVQIHETGDWREQYQTWDTYLLEFCKPHRLWSGMKSVTRHQIEMSHHSLHAPGIFVDMVDCPSHRRAECLSQHRSTGFADGRQLLVRPFIRMALPQLFHQETVRYHDQVHVPCL